MIEEGVAHAAAEHAAGNVGLVPGPVPGCEDSGKNELSEGGHKVDSPVEREQVEPLKPESLGGLFVLGELAFDGAGAGARLKR